MKVSPLNFFIVFLFIFPLISSTRSFSQKTQIRGFVDATTSYEDGKLSFGLGEQDLFITSELNDRFSFLGESVFKFSLGSPTSFDVSVERVIMKFNYKGNHNLLLGKHHTPVNYWNDTYHHGRVFFPTIDRPLVFSAGLLPLHTTGISAQGLNLGELRFGYDIMIGNGLGSGELKDNDKNKSFTAAVHIKPIDGLRLGVSYYHDRISKGARVHEHIIINDVKQQLTNASIAYFGKKVEFLSETLFAFNHTDSTGSKRTIGTYTYAGIKIKEKWIPYIRFDHINYKDGEIFFHKDNTTSFIGGLRYEINYLAVVKLEYQHEKREMNGRIDRVVAQVAIGF